MNKKSDFYVPKFIVCIVGILFGCFIIIYGITNDSHRYLSYVDTVEFGADYYTEQHAATVAVADNLCDIYCQINDIAQITFLTIGAAFILGFLLALFVIIGNHIRYKVEQNKALSANLRAQEFANN